MGNALADAAGYSISSVKVSAIWLAPPGSPRTGVAITVVASATRNVDAKAGSIRYVTAVIAASALNVS